MNVVVAVLLEKMVSHEPEGGLWGGEPKALTGHI